MSTFFIIVARKFRDAGEVEKTTEIAFNKIYTATDTSTEKKIPLNTVFRSAMIARGGEPLSEALIDDFLRQIPPTLVDRENLIKTNDLINIIMADLPPINSKEKEESNEEAPEEGPVVDKPRSFFSFLRRTEKPVIDDREADENNNQESEKKEWRKSIAPTFNNLYDIKNFKYLSGNYSSVLLIFNKNGNWPIKFASP